MNEDEIRDLYPPIPELRLELEGGKFNGQTGSFKKLDGKTELTFQGLPPLVMKLEDEFYSRSHISDETHCWVYRFDRKEND